MLTIGVLRSSSHHPEIASGVAALGCSLSGNLFGFFVEKEADPLLLHELCRISPDPGSWYAKCGVRV